MRLIYQPKDEGDFYAPGMKIGDGITVQKDEGEILLATGAFVEPKAEAKQATEAKQAKEGEK